MCQDLSKQAGSAMKGWTPSLSLSGMWEFFSNWKSAQRVRAAMIRTWADDQRSGRNGGKEKQIYMGSSVSSHIEGDASGRYKYVISIK